MITPISLESDIEIIRGQTEQVRKAGLDRFHIDIIDGLYADNVTVVPADLQEIDFKDIKLDLHILVDDPTEWIEECVAICPDRILAQVERMGNIEYFVEAMKSYGEVKIGLGLDIYTPVDTLSEELLSKIDAVILMSIKAGYSGSPFKPEILPKIKQLREKWEGPIVIDGGINPETYIQVLSAGASEAGANSAIWKGNFEENLSKFKESEEKWKRK